LLTSKLAGEKLCGVASGTLFGMACCGLAGGGYVVALIGKSNRSATAPGMFILTRPTAAPLALSQAATSTN
jgi:hypothetical protein